VNKWPDLVQEGGDVRVVEVNQYDHFISWSARVLFIHSGQGAIAVCMGRRDPKGGHIGDSTHFPAGADLHLNITRIRKCAVVNIARIDQ